MSRPPALFVAAALAVACGAVAAVDDETLERAAVRQMATADLRGLGRLAGLSEAPGEPLPVFVQQDGGPLWVAGAVTDAVRSDPKFRPDPNSPHRLAVEVVHGPSAWVLRLSLWRQGWSLRSPEPQRLALAPWVFTATATIGAIAALAARRIAVGLLVAGLLAQLLVLALPVLWGPLAPEEAGAWMTAWKHGPLGQGVLALADAMSGAAAGVGLAIVAACLVLIAWDHRRSRGTGGKTVAWGFAGLLGALTWLEGSARTGLFAYAVTMAGVAGLMGLAGLWAWVATHLHVRGRAPRWSGGAGLLVCSLVSGVVGGCKSGQGDPPPAETRTVSASAEAPIAPVAAVHTVESWLDLLAQRPSAVVLRDGAVVVDLGLEHARKHLAIGRQDQWRLGAVAHDRTGGIVVGRTASLDVPLDGDLSPAMHPGDETRPGLAMALTLHALVPKQSVTVLLNERVLAHLTLSEGWERRTLSLPADLVQPGDNRVRLHFRRTGPWEDLPAAAAIVQHVTVGSHDRITEPPPESDRPAYRAEPELDGVTRLHLMGGTAVAYYVIPPPRSKLRIRAQGHGALDVRVSTSEDHAAGRPATVVLDEPLRPSERKSDLDLTGWSGVPIRIEVRVRGSTEDAVGSLSRLGIILPRTMPVDRAPRKPRDIIVMSVEGFRADALQPDRQPRLPNIEALMERALVFERAYALSPQAIPSHAAWLSSVTPPVHLTVRGTFVADGQKLMPEILGRAGYFRVVMTSNDYLNHERGLWQGFDSMRILGDLSEEEHAEAVIAAGLDSLRSRRQRWFLLANVNDPQAPYDPPRDLLRGMEIPLGAPPPHHTHLWVSRVRLGKTVPDAAQLAYVRRLYRGELQVIDRALGTLEAGLREADRLDDAIIVLVGVHGEEFFEHGGAGHDRALYEESIRVPLIMHAPAVLEPGRVTTPVDLLDVSPTLADLVGATAPDIWQGESLLPLGDDPQPPPRLVVAYLGDGGRAALVGNYKIIMAAGGNERFFDLSVDPGEQTDRLAEGGVAVRVVRAALAWQLAHEKSWRRARWGTGANLRPAFALDLGM